MPSHYIYLIAAACFIIALKGLASPSTARRGNIIGVVGMVLAIYGTLSLPHVQPHSSLWLAIGLGGIVGTFIALRINMTAMPQLVAGFHSLVGLAACLVATAALITPQAFDIVDNTGNIYLSSLIEMGLGAIIGAITFTGSIVAFAKLQGLLKSSPLHLPHRHLINAGLFIFIIFMLYIFSTTGSGFAFFILLLASLALGFLLITPIGGADMPVIVSMLNSYSGWAAVGIGFTLNNTLLIITGALVGASGAILSYIMCKAMNRSIWNVIFGGIGSTTENNKNNPTQEDGKEVKSGNAEDAAFLLSNANSVIVVPGYGMAVAQAQHALRDVADNLLQRNITVRYAIHPVAGRMPGHMNVLLAEANVSYDQVFELDDINNDFSRTDVVLVIGANDITNPAARSDPQSPIYGMPILDVDKAQHVLFIKRSMSPGYSGIDNDLFYRDNTIMLFDDAKKMTESITKALEHL